MKKLTTRQIALNGVVAGLYAAITILTASFAYEISSSASRIACACSSCWSRV